MEDFEQKFGLVIEIMVRKILESDDDSDNDIVAKSDLLTTPAVAEKEDSTSEITLVKTKKNAKRVKAMEALRKRSKGTMNALDSSESESEQDHDDHNYIDSNENDSNDDNDISDDEAERIALQEKKKRKAKRKEEEKRRGKYDISMTCIMISNKCVYMYEV